ncbi:MAG: histidinol dehydrogenase [Smithellaceae bacterium]|nr:histidinol dehydrogenase [Smithellaceae bacterium]
MKILRTRDCDLPGVLKLIRRETGLFDEQVSSVVQGIAADVAARGDEALYHHTRRLDGYEIDAASMEATPEELAAAAGEVAPADEEIIRSAAGRIEAYHRKQLASLGDKDWHYQEGQGIRLGQLVRPLSRVGVYAPGGQAAYPSSVLMAAIPARIAGVNEIFLVSPLRQGRLNPFVALAAGICGVDRVFKVGGAQAIAALAYGTEHIPRVDKIVGPGNAYVAAAKKHVFGLVDIDMIAGPSEILIIADHKADPGFIAADLIGQAEHDELACAILVTDDDNLAGAVQAEIASQLSSLPRRDIARRALEEHGAIVITGDVDEAIELANFYGPEHLELMLASPEKWIKKVRNAGCVFLGASTPETVGDYIAGSNHILPTGGTARFSSPLGVYDFIKRISVVSFAPEDLATFGPLAAGFARLEGLDGHARAVALRLERKKS